MPYDVNQTRKSRMELAALLDDYSYDPPKRGEFRDAEILMIEHDRILVDLGAKTDGVVTPREMKKTDETILEELSEGDVVPVYVLKPPSMLRKPTVSIQRGAEKADWDRIVEMMETGEIHHLKVVGKNKGGLLVRSGRVTGFLPASLCTAVSRAPDRTTANKIKANLVGEFLPVQVIEARPRRNKLIFSGRKDAEALQEHLMEKIAEGDIVTGIVMNIVEYGAFIDLLGVDGLLHISEFDWQRVEDPNTVLEVGDKIEVKVLDINMDKGRISLSRKAVIDPLEAYAFDEEEDQEDPETPAAEPELEAAEQA